MKQFPRKAFPLFPYCSPTTSLLRQEVVDLKSEFRGFQGTETDWLKQIR